MSFSFRNRRRRDTHAGIDRRGERVLGSRGKRSIKRLRVGAEAAEENICARCSRNLYAGRPSRVCTRLLRRGQLQMPGVKSGFRRFLRILASSVPRWWRRGDCAGRGFQGRARALLQIAGTGSNTVGRRRTAAGVRRRREFAVGRRGFGYWIGVNSLRRALHAP